MNLSLRGKIQDLSNDAADLLKKNLDGKTKIEGGMFDRLVRLLGHGLKVEHMDQLQMQNDRSFGLRLLPFIKDENARQKYMELTNPSIKPLLTSKRRVKNKFLAWLGKAWLGSAKLGEARHSKQVFNFFYGRAGRMTHKQWCGK